MEMERDWTLPATPAAPVAAPTATKPAAKEGGEAGGTSFGSVLSMLNPLQYVPVVGMIYRGVTGDTIPEPVRIAGGLAFSALTGGPVGIVLTAAADVAEEALGIDPDKIAHSMLASLGLAAPTKAAPVLQAAAHASPAPKPVAGSKPAAAPAAGFADAGTPLSPAPAAVAAVGAEPVRQAAARTAYAWAATDSMVGAAG